MPFPITGLRCRFCALTGVAHLSQHGTGAVVVHTLPAGFKAVSSEYGDILLRGVQSTGICQSEASSLTASQLIALLLNRPYCQVGKPHPAPHARAPALELDWLPKQGRSQSV